MNEDLHKLQNSTDDDCSCKCTMCEDLKPEIEMTQDDKQLKRLIDVVERFHECEFKIGECHGLIETFIENSEISEEDKRRLSLSIQTFGLGFRRTLTAIRLGLDEINKKKASADKRYIENMIIRCTAVMAR